MGGTVAQTEDERVPMRKLLYARRRDINFEQFKESGGISKRIIKNRDSISIAVSSAEAGSTVSSGARLGKLH